MVKILKIVLLLTIFILAGGFIIYKSSFKIPEVDSPANYFPSEAERKLNQLTLEQKIGQIFIIGFDGEKVNENVENLIKKFHPGGILLLKRNIKDEEQLRELINSLQKIALEDTGLPLFISVDQEGGLISRIEWIEKTPQSEIEAVDQAYLIGQNRGKELRELGINLNLAPLLDITQTTDFIFERSFQKDFKIMGDLAEALIQGQKEAGIFVAVKHFPGYGKISFNPEEKLAALEKIPEISQFQIAAAASDGSSEAGLAPLGREAPPEMIMTSNVIYEELDENLPFSFSEKGIQFLKKKIRGNYLVISDDLSQNSLLAKFSLKEIVTLPIIAGVDILIFSGWRVPVTEGVLALREVVENEEISEKRINQSVLKIIKLKQNLLK